MRFVFLSRPEMVSFRQACLAWFHGCRLARSAGPRPISPGNRSCQNPAEPWKERSSSPVLTEGAGLLGTSMQVIAGRLDPDEQHVPFDMFTGSCGASAGKDLVE